MKPRTIKFSKLTYTIDLPVLLLFVAVSLDVVSTTLFVSLDSGSEKNPILSKLIDRSIWFIPVYLFVAYAIFVPFLSDILRKTFSYTFAFVSIILGVNNSSLMIFDSAFLIDSIGFYGMVILFTLFGFAIFAFFLIRGKLNRKEIVITCSKFSLFLLFLGLIHLVFIVMA
jgi:hypothetical protein